MSRLPFISPSRFLAALLLAGLPVAQAATHLGTISVNADNGSTLDVPVGLTSSDGVSCVQFDLVYDPAQLTLGAARTGEGAPNHLVGSTLVTPGRERVVLYSSSLAPLAGGYVVKVPATWATSGRSNVNVDSVKLVTSSGISVTLTSSELVPEVVSSPSQSKIYAGGSTTFQVQVSGVGDIEYQWYLNDVAIEGATGSSYTISSASVANTGIYSVRIHTASGDTTTTPFALTLSLPSHLFNISTRGVVLSGDNILIPGFVVQGEMGSHKRVLVRAVGPRLKDFGIPEQDLLADPLLQLVRLHDPAPAESIATNDDWSTSPDAAAIRTAEGQSGAFHLDGTAEGGLNDTKSSAVLVDLEPGNYTAISSGKGGTTGVALVEVYDVSGDTSHLMNVSNRGYVGTGQQVMIPGFYVNGESPATFLIRGIGPGLVQFGLDKDTVLKNPLIHVIQSGTTQTVVGQNDDWDQAPNDPVAIAAAAVKVGAFGLTPESADACVLVTLQPGAYTVVCEGVGGTTGTALVEVYQVQ